jgi:hypothetical protein
MDLTCGPMIGAGAFGENGLLKGPLAEVSGAANIIATMTTVSHTFETIPSTRDYILVRLLDTREKKSRCNI